MDTAWDVLHDIMEKMRNESGSIDPMEPFNYDKEWEDLAVRADKILNGN